MLAAIVLALCFLLAVAGIVIPILPATLIAFAGVLIHQLWMGDASAGWTFVGIAAGLTVLSMVVDYVATVWGARRFGASWQGALGALLGGIVGAIFFNIPGIILGPIVGAVLFEFIQHRNPRQAARAGWGTFLGGLVAFAAKLACTAGIIGGFYLAL